MLLFPGDDRRTKNTRPSENRAGSFPIDIVYTWVDQSDPAWLEKRSRAIAALDRLKDPGLCRDGIREKEFESLDGLRFSPRSLSRYAGFARKIFIVSDDQAPAWLNQEHPKIELVTHREIFGGSGELPCFNSHAIESRLHHIPGLADHFIYMNEDFFLGRPVTVGDFFQTKDISRFFPSPMKIDLTPVSADDLAISAAAKQGRALLQKRFKKSATRHIGHAPDPLRRSVLFEMERIFPQAFSVTAAHPFRHQNDQSIAAFLYFYYAWFSGRAVPAKIRYMYIDGGMHHFLRKALFTLLGRRYQTFCINGGHTTPQGSQIRLTLLRAFLKLCFPDICEFEKYENKHS